MRNPVLKPVILKDLPVFHRAGCRQLPPGAQRAAAGRTNLLHIDNDASVSPHCCGAGMVFSNNCTAVRAR
jgi:hypothetical protein